MGEGKSGGNIVTSCDQGNQDSVPENAICMKSFAKKKIESQRY